MAKLLLVVAVFAVVYLVLRNYRRRMERRPPAGQGAARGASRHGEDMVRCQVCGVHLPRSEAVTSRGEMFCSREHLQLADRESRGS